MNNFSVDVIVGTRAELGTRVGVDLKFWSRKPGIAKLGILEASLPCTIILLEAKSLSGLLETIKLNREFIQ